MKKEQMLKELNNKIKKVFKTKYEIWEYKILNLLDNNPVSEYDYIYLNNYNELIDFIKWKFNTIKNYLEFYNLNNSKVNYDLNNFEYEIEKVDYKNSELTISVNYLFNNWEKVNFEMVIETNKK